MNTNQHNEQEGKNLNVQIEQETTPADQLNQAEETNDSANQDEPNRKKYHSSAMYAASKLHDAVQHVRPKHTGLDL